MTKIINKVDCLDIEKLIHCIQFKLYKCLQEWKTLHPNCDNSLSPHNDDFNDLINKLMDGSPKNIQKVCDIYSKK